MNEERAAHVALPKLYGAPAYARPPVAPVSPVERPFDPDDLPLESERTSDDLALAQDLQPHAYESAPGDGSAPPKGDGGSALHGRPFRLRLPGRGG